MDEDFYIEDHYKRNAVIVILIILLVIGGLYYGYKNYYKKNYLKIKDVTVELGSKLSTDIKDYIKCNNYDDYKLDLSAIVTDSDGKVSSVGEYAFKVIKKDVISRGKVFVKDTTKPIVGVNDLTVGVNEEYNAYDFVNTCTDLSMPCVVSFKDANDGDLSSKVGNYKIEIIISDNANNKVNKTVKLTVKEGYSFKEVKEKDFNVDHTSNDKSNWNNTYTIKFEKALEEESTEFNELLESYGIKEFSYDKNIKEKEIIVIYNKYNYALGLSIKVTFDDNSYEFVTEDKVKSDVPEE